MNLRLYTPVYTLTLLLSAALLFSVQPMFSKMVLPLLGGTPQVWNTAMLFFQVMLLGGYAYAHGTTKLMGIKAQAILHIVLLLGFVVVLPIAIPEGWTPPIDQDPTMWQLSLMSLTVGGPFFVLAGSAPMLQRWFSHTHHPDADNPYFLYGASNLGSMTALLAYPLLFEPLMTLPQQSAFWTGGYGILIALTIGAAALVWRYRTQSEKPETTQIDEHISWARRIKWLMLALIPSSLMLGVTTFITTDIASVPLLWILPLALYVGTFIIVFARKQLFSTNSIMLAQGAMMIVLIVQMLAFELRPFLLITFHMGLFFVSALACHTELANSRPSAKHLTEFYLIMSIGGALGGFFNAIIAPNFLVIPIEYGLALIAVCFMRYANKPAEPFRISAAFYVLGLTAALAMIGFESLHKIALYIIAFGLTLCLGYLLKTRYMFAFAVAVCLIFNPPGHSWGQKLYDEIIHQDRNFFGVIKVIDSVFDQRILLHGTTNHGTQATLEKYRLTPLSYYSENSPLSDAFEIYDSKPGAQNIAVLGLGIGVVACFEKKNRHFDFFEIDPDIVGIAENPNYFTFLSDCGSQYDVILGDARLTIGDKPENKYDIIVLDAFSSDNIPIHLLTVEAIELYLEKLKPDGLLMFNVSNNFLDIEPVLTNAAQELDIPGYAKVSNSTKIEDTKLETYMAHFFAFDPDNSHKTTLAKRGWTAGNSRQGVKLWTDKYSNIISVLENKTSLKRIREVVKKEKEL